MADITGRIGDIVPIRSSFDYELQLIREAIAMVATGKSPRVVVAAIRYGDLLLDAAEPLAEDAGVVLQPLERGGQGGIDIAVQRAIE